ncbi:phage tail tube protein [Herbidospora mongoliensis]|uniref:phage tail tube protein n=1 Tax=Herbidospora mongoliensis TaxID=688067 RepID=UPI000833ABDB|nr:phage tail tube protein [Herbidospora mongoliensis]
MSAVDGFGCQFLRSDGESPATYTATAGVTSVGGPEIERENYETTAHDSAEKWRTFLGGLKDGGEVSLELRYDPRDHDTLIEDFEDDEPRDYRLIWPEITGAQWDFQAILTGFSPEGPFDDLLSAEVTFKVSGKPVIS